MHQVLVAEFCRLPVVVCFPVSITGTEKTGCIHGTLETIKFSLRFLLSQFLIQIKTRGSSINTVDQSLIVLLLFYVGKNSTLHLFVYRWTRLWSLSTFMTIYINWTIRGPVYHVAFPGPVSPLVSETTTSLSLLLPNLQTSPKFSHLIFLLNWENKNIYSKIGLFKHNKNMRHPHDIKLILD